MEDKFCVVSSKDGWQSQGEMAGSCGVYRYVGPLTEPGHEFQILRNGSRDAAIFPSVHRADPFTAHVLQGPGKNEQGHSWAIEAGRAGEAREVVLSCPRGRPLSVSWSERGGHLPDTNPTREMMPAEDRLGQMKLFNNKSFGRWRLTRELGRGKQRAAVFLAEHGGHEAALKFPVPVRGELQHLAALAGVPGVPEVLDYGQAPDGGAFHVTPLLGASLQKVLERQERRGLGGRISWLAAQGLGTQLLATLQGIHSRGLLHCDLSPSNVLLGPDGARPFLIDFGLARPIGSASCSSGNGTYEYSSIRAGLPGERAPADDLESLGWLLWRCVVGPVPWRCTPKQIDWSDAQARQQVSERISKSKQHMLQGGFGVFGSRYAHCPRQLQEYLRHAKRLGDEGGGATEEDYARLAALLEAPGAEQCWVDVAREADQVAVYKAADGRLLWRPLDEPSSLQAELLPVDPGQRVAVAARSSPCGQILEGGRWAEVEPVWMPGLPSELSQRCWILLADWGTQLMRRVKDGEAEDEEEGRGGTVGEPEDVAEGGDAPAAVAAQVDAAAALDEVERRIAERRRRRKEKAAANEAASDGEGDLSDGGAERELWAVSHSASRGLRAARRAHQLHTNVN